MSFAVTLSTPLASISNVTSIFGTLRGAGGMPSRWKLPIFLLSSAIGRSPWKTCDLDRRLVVRGGGEGLALSARDRRVPRDHRRQHAAERLDAERQRGHVEQLDVGRRAEEQLRALDRRADRDDFVRVDAPVPFLAEDLLHQLLHARHSRHAADHDDFVDLARRAASRP